MCLKVETRPKPHSSGYLFEKKSNTKDEYKDICEHTCTDTQSSPEKTQGNIFELSKYSFFFFGSLKKKYEENEKTNRHAHAHAFSFKVYIL